MPPVWDESSRLGEKKEGLANQARQLVHFSPPRPLQFRYLWTLEFQPRGPCDFQELAGAPGLRWTRPSGYMLGL
jgi:hypothetical protein